MHLLLAQKGQVSSTEEAIDLNQTPADMLFLSFADSELTLLAHSFGQGNFAFTLRLANLNVLTHFFSVDLYLKKTAAFAKIIIIRLLGGRSYWSYGVERLYQLAVRHKISLVFLPGDDKFDSELQSYSTISSSDWYNLWQYFIEGGEENIKNFLLYCQALLTNSQKPSSAQILPKAGLWYKGKPESMLERQLFDAANKAKKKIAICFYRTLLQSNQTEPIAALVRAIEAQGALAIPFYVSSLKNDEVNLFLEKAFDNYKPDIVFNLTAFSVSMAAGAFSPTILDQKERMVLQLVIANSSYETWHEGTKGLNAQDLVMNVALTEMDGRLLTRAIAFKKVSFYDEKTQTNLLSYHIAPDRVNFVIALAFNWLKLRDSPAEKKKIALLLSNYPAHDGRLGHAVGLDSIASAFHILKTLKRAGYKVENLPKKSDDLLGAFFQKVCQFLSLKDYQYFFSAMPVIAQQAVLSRWGTPQDDPHYSKEGFAVFVQRFGNVVLAIQPDRHPFARETKRLHKDAYHDLELVPPHSYLAFYFWLRFVFGLDACVHLGKHGNLEWLPGKALALSNFCFPELALGATPHIYPFIINDPGEALQAKRRSSAVIIGHLIPPMKVTKTYGQLQELELLVDEYYHAANMDSRRLVPLQEQIMAQIAALGLDKTLKLDQNDPNDQKLAKIDAFLCDLKNLQIRNGLHIFGKLPNSEQLLDLLLSLVHFGDKHLNIPSLREEICADLALDLKTIEEDLSAVWCQEKPILLKSLSKKTWRSHSDGLTRINSLARQYLAASFFDNSLELPLLPRTAKALKIIKAKLWPCLLQSVHNEMEHLLAALAGRFVPPGPSGAPTRGDLSLLPTGRNLYGIDNRSMPSFCAWQMGKKSANLLVLRYVQDHGEWPKAFGLNVWGTANIRTGGDDIAQALALIGAEPIWNKITARIEGYQIIPLSQLKRPRVDVFLRVSGFFRDTFSQQMQLFQDAITKIAQLDEAIEDNPIRAHFQKDSQALCYLPKELAQKKASLRIFSSAATTYGTGIEAMLKFGQWQSRQELSQAWRAHSCYVYQDGEMQKDETLLEMRLEKLDAVIQNQDNREHDLLDNLEYAISQGGMAAAVMNYRPEISIYHNDLSSKDQPLIKSLEEELARTLHGRALNPTWIKAMHEHGYRGGAELCMVVDSLFVMAATTHKVCDQQFWLLFQAYLQSEETYNFLKQKNLPALKAIAQTFEEAIKRGLWKVKQNSVYNVLTRIKEEL